MILDIRDHSLNALCVLSVVVIFFFVFTLGPVPTLYVNVVSQALSWVAPRPAHVDPPQRRRLSVFEPSQLSSVEHDLGDPNARLAAAVGEPHRAPDVVSLPLALFLVGVDAVTPTGKNVAQPDE